MVPMSGGGVWVVACPGAPLPSMRAPGTTSQGAGSDGPTRVPVRRYAKSPRFYPWASAACLGPCACGDTRERRLPARVERLPDGIEVDDDRCVVRRCGWPLARLAIDLRPCHTGREIGRHVQQVDAHALVPMEASRPVVPPAV